MRLFEKVDKDYITFPTTLENYEWFKPIIIIVIAVILLYAVFPTVLSGIFYIFIPDFLTRSVSPENQPYTIIGLTSLVITAFITPAVYIPTRYIYKISFSEMVAPIRKWNWMALFMSLAVALVIYGIFEAIYVLILGKPIVNKYTLFTFVLSLILVPLQCFAEEFMYRGLVMQTIGSWFKIPIVSILLTAIIFTLVHEQYNLIGLSQVAAGGLCLCYLAYYTQGMEASTALHIINNLFSFGLIGLSIETGDVTLLSAAFTAIMAFTSTAAIIFLDKRFNFFDSCNKVT